MRGIRKSLGVYLFVLTSLSPSFASRAQTPHVPDIDHSIDAIFEQWAKPDSPGCSVGVQQEGSPPIVRSYGSADLEHGVAITPATVFEAGSVSKQFTAASVLLLAEEGEIGLSDDVRRYVPELPDYGTPITVNELLSHTSGLRDWGEVEGLAGWERSSRIYTLTDVLDIASRQRHLNYRPGTAYSYTNTGFNLLAIIVERVSGKTLAQFSREHLFKPLGMNHTQWRDDFRRVVKDRAIAYDTGSEGYRQLMPFENAYGNGGLLTTIGDLLRWNEALAGGELGPFVTTELQRQATLDNGHVIAYARGLFIESYHGVREVGHAGATAGYRAWLARYPQQHLSIAVLCNAADIDTRLVAHRVADLFLPVPAPGSPPVLTLTAAQVAMRAGLYIDQRMGMPLRMEVQGEALRIADGPVLVAASPSEFRAGSTTYRFSADNVLTRETVDGDVLEYRSMHPWHPAARELLPFAGRYHSAEALATALVAVEDDGLTVVPEDRHDDALVLHPLFADTFEFSNATRGDGVLHFSRDAKGRLTGFEMSNPRVHGLAFRRSDGGQRPPP